MKKKDGKNKFISGLLIILGLECLEECAVPVCFIIIKLF